MMNLWQETKTFRNINNLQKTINLTSCIIKDAQNSTLLELSVTISSVRLHFNTNLQIRLQKSFVCSYFPFPFLTIKIFFRHEDYENA